MPTTNFNSIDITKCEYEDLAVHYGTGRFISKQDPNDKRAGHYRSGKKTNLGDIEESEWVRLAQELIRHKGDEEAFALFQKWYTVSPPFPMKKEEHLMYCLECFIKMSGKTSEFHSGDESEYLISPA